VPAEEGDDGCRRLADHHVDHYDDHHVGRHDGHHVGRHDDSGPPPENVRRCRETAVFATHPTTIRQIGDDQIPNEQNPNCRIAGRFHGYYSDENRRNGDRRSESLPNEDRSRAHQSSVHHPNSGDEMSHPRTGNDEDEGNQP